MCELYVLSHLHENLSGLGASTVCLLYTAQLSCQKTQECETFLCVECTKTKLKEKLHFNKDIHYWSYCCQNDPKGQCLKLFCSLSFNKTVFLLITMKGGVQTCITTQSMMVFTHTCVTKFSVSNHLRTQPLIRESMVKRPTYYSNKLWTVSVLMPSDLTYQGC